MSQKPFYVDIDLNGNQLKNAIIGPNSFISSVEGAITYDSGDILFRDASTTQTLASKQFIAGKIYHTIVTVATTSNVSLSGTQNIDNVSLNVGQKILVKDQSSPSENGVYIVQSSDWTPDPDSNIVLGFTVYVLSGNENAQTDWIVYNLSPITFLKKYIIADSGTAGWATNAAHAFTADNATLLNNQNSSFYLNRTNHTGTQTASTISDFNASVLSLGASGTAGWATNAAFAYSTGTTASNGLTKTSNNVTLGGSLTQATTLVLGDNSLTINAAASTSGFGLKYAADYSNQYTTRSLVDKGYVDSKNNRTIGITVDGSGQVLTTGIKGYIVAGFSGTIVGWDIVADVTGSCVFDIWKATGSVPTIANTITASAKPTLSSQQLVSSSNVTSWNKTVTIGDTIAFNINSVSTITRVTLTIRISS